MFVVYLRKDDENVDEKEPDPFVGKENVIETSSSVLAKNSNSNKISYTCELCNESFSEDCELQKHYSVHINKHPYACLVCLKTFSEESALIAHPCCSGKSILVCDICNKTFHEEDIFKKHYLTHSAKRPYACKVCDRRFIWKKNRDRHCALNRCFKELKKQEKADLKRHEIEKRIQNKRQRGKPHTCNICGKVFKKFYYLKIHLPTHTNDRAFVCEDCGRRFNAKRNLRVHCRRFHIGIRPHVCEICEKGFLSRKELVTHSYVHTEEKPYNCQKCGAGFCHRKSLSRHILLRRCPKKILQAQKKMNSGDIKKSQSVSNSDMTMDFENIYDVYSNSSTQNSKSPTSDHDSSSEQPFSCELCNEHFEQIKDLHEHYTVHSPELKLQLNKTLATPSSLKYVKEQRYGCDICGKSYRWKKDLRRHSNSHTPRNFVCQGCLKGFDTESDLKEHKCPMIPKGAYTCDVCSETFQNEIKFKTHYTIHADEKPFVCDVCNKCFRLKDSLKKHKFIHTNGKDYVCNVCGKAFSLRINLISHSKVHQREELDLNCSEWDKVCQLEKPHCCDTCGRSFAKKSDLKKHQMEHIDEKDYYCEVCGKGFTLKSALKAHIQYHLEEKPFSCNLCDKSFFRKTDLVLHFSKCSKKKPTRGAYIKKENSLDTPPTTPQNEDTSSSSKEDKSVHEPVLILKVESR